MKAYQRKSGFTLVEIIIVVVILAIAAALAVPMLSSGSDMQLRSAANMIAADLEYAKSMAITTGQNHTVDFDVANDQYEIRDAGGIVIAHPVKAGFDYQIDIREQLDQVDLSAANFDSNPQVIFDSLGSPDNGGTVTLTASGYSMTVDVEPITGYISISE